MAACHRQNKKLTSLFNKQNVEHGKNGHNTHYSLMDKIAEL